MRRRILWLCLATACASSLVACAGSGEGLDSSGRPVGPGGGPGPLTATFQSIQDNVFTPICSVCHAGGAAPQGLRLDAVNSYAMIVGVPSVEEPSVLRIKPGDPDNSYLIQKIEGHAAVGAQMPFGGPPLPAATIAVMRQWVTDGAVAAATAAGQGSFEVVAAVPASGEVILESPARIVVRLSRDLDVTQLTQASVRLERVTAAPAERAAIAVPVDITVPAGNNAALLVAPRAPIPDGRYRLLVPRPPDGGLADLSGARLGDGDQELVIADFLVEAGK